MHLSSRFVVIAVILLVFLLCILWAAGSGKKETSSNQGMS
jgi:cbb3-type cytochrome oxidase subunit 3